MDQSRDTAHYDSSLSACNAVMTSFTGRDKVVRLVQYASRFLRGFFPVLGQKGLAQKFDNVFLRTIADRRTYRWLNAFPTLINLCQIINGTTSWAWGKELHKKVMFTLYSSLILLFEIFDHGRWFAEVKWLNFERRLHWMRVSFSFFTLACIVSALHHLEETYFKHHENNAKKQLARRSMKKFTLHILTFSRRRNDAFGRDKSGRNALWILRNVDQFNGFAFALAQIACAVKQLVGGCPL